MLLLIDFMEPKTNPQQKEITAKKNWAKPDLAILDRDPIKGGGRSVLFSEITGTINGSHVIKNRSNGNTYQVSTLLYNNCAVS